jgi:hypothetical protein
MSSTNFSRVQDYSAKALEKMEEIKWDEGETN